MKTTNGLQRLGITLCGLSALALVGCGGDSDHDDVEQPQPQSLSCEQLPGLAIPADAFALATSGGEVTAATVVAASGSGAAALPEHCLVEGRIAPVDPAAPDILFKVALPADWNKKALMFGGGGFNGSIPNITGNIAQGAVDQPLPVARGYATFASDSGHQANALGSQDGRWGLNDEAVDNFAGDALKKTRDASMFIINKRYGSAPAHSYFAGGSTGGREALTSIQRWPDDWDGAIAWYPAWNDAEALLAGQHYSRALSQPGAYPSFAKRQLLLDAALEACDELDGLADELINDQRQCNAIFDPSTAMVNGNPLRCPGGGDDGDSCLSDAQINALKTMDQGVTFNFPLASGETGYPGSNVWGADLGIDTSTPVGNTITFLNFGYTAPVFPNMPQYAPYLSVLVDQWVKYSVARDASFNSYNLDPINPAPQYAQRISELSVGLNAGTNISAFEARGGKLLLAHGMSDVLVSTRATEMYYGRLLNQMGAEKVDSFVRFYEVAGFGHAASLSFNATWDSLTALEDWVEDGTAPENQVTTDTVGAPGRTRPLCDYPAWPRYIDGGDPMEAASFECAQE
ncbi:MAG: tannase/feruloyl esterase family alpha/beta hydrolase [Alcanivorax sp.]|nr:tannase/feruloyl esterase family alpha/beta hydrolase [Alcanivorax sp.]